MRVPHRLIHNIRIPQRLPHRAKSHNLASTLTLIQRQFNIHKEMIINCRLDILLINPKRKFLIQTLRIDTGPFKDIILSFWNNLIKNRFQLCTWIRFFQLSFTFFEFFDSFLIVLIQLLECLPWFNTGRKLELLDFLAEGSPDSIETFENVVKGFLLDVVDLCVAFSFLFLPLLLLFFLY